MKRREEKKRRKIRTNPIDGEISHLVIVDSKDTHATALLPISENWPAHICKEGGRGEREEGKGRGERGEGRGERAILQFFN